MGKRKPRAGPRLQVFKQDCVTRPDGVIERTVGGATAVLQPLGPEEREEDPPDDLDEPEAQPTPTPRRPAARRKRGRKNGTPSHNGKREPSKKLTRKESEVYELAAQGMKAKQIGRALDLSHRTVQGHVSHILGKLGLKNKYELVAHAKKQKERDDGKGQA